MVAPRDVSPADAGALRGTREDIVRLQRTLNAWRLVARESARRVHGAPPASPSLPFAVLAEDGVVGPRTLGAHSLVVGLARTVGRVGVVPFRVRPANASPPPSARGAASDVGSFGAALATNAELRERLGRLIPVLPS